MTPAYSARLRLIDLVHLGQVTLNSTSRSGVHQWRNKTLNAFSDSDFESERAELINEHVASSGLTYQDVEKLLISVEKQYVAVLIKKIRDLASRDAGE